MIVTLATYVLMQTACGVLLPLQQRGVILPPQPRDEAAVRKEREQVLATWREELTKVCEVERIEAMVVSLPTNVMFKAWRQPYGVAGMRMLGRALGANWLQINGVQTLGFANYDSEPFDAVLWPILRALDPETKKRLVSGDLKLSDLGAAGADLALAVATDPPMATILLERGGGAKVQANLAVHGRYVDPSTGKTKYIFFDTGADGGPPVSPEPTDDAQPLFAYSPLKPHIGGPLDLGSGSVITLEEFRNRAQDVFGARYYLDSRLKDEYVYVRGTMDQETFELVYREVAAAVPPLRKPETLRVSQEELAHLIEEMGVSDADAAVLERMGLSLGDVFGGKGISAKDLASRDPSLRARLEAYGVPPDAVIQLRGGLELTLDPGGWRDVGPPLDVNGRTVRRAASNRVVFGFVSR